MKKINLLLGVFIFSNICCLQAQSKSEWFVAPQIGIATTGDGSGNLNWGYNANFTLGHYMADLGKHGRLRTDICAGYFGFSGNRSYSVAAIFTGCDNGTTKWYHSVSLGIGTQKSENSNKADFTIPVKMTLPFTAYRFNNKMCVGLDWGTNINLSSFATGTPVYLGLFFGLGL